MQKIALDMDDVLANTHEKLVDIVLNEFNTRHSREDFFQHSFEELLQYKQMERLTKILNRPGFFASIEVKEDAVETVSALSKYYEIFVASAAMEFNNSFRDKFDWLDLYFPFIPWTHRIFCGDKSILHTDFLIDDNMYNIRAFKGDGILFSAPHNLKENHSRRANTWKDIQELFLP